MCEKGSAGFTRQMGWEKGSMSSTTCDSLGHLLLKPISLSLTVHGPQLVSRAGPVVLCKLQGGKAALGLIPEPAKVNGQSMVIPRVGDVDLPFFWVKTF